MIGPEGVSDARTAVRPRLRRYASAGRLPVRLARDGARRPRERPRYRRAARAGAERERSRALAAGADRAAELQQAVGFRNIIVHQYIGIDYNLVYDALHNDLDRLEAFLTAVSAFVQGQP